MAFLAILPLHLLTMLIGLVLLIVYILHAMQNQELDQNARLLWLILFLVGGLISMPIYYFKYVLPLEDDPGPPTSTAT